MTFLLFVSARRHYFLCVSVVDTAKTDANARVDGKVSERTEGARESRREPEKAREGQRMIEGGL